MGIDYGPIVGLVIFIVLLFVVTPVMIYFEKDEND